MRISVFLVLAVLLMTSCTEKADPKLLMTPAVVTNALFQAMADGDCEKMRLLVDPVFAPEFVPDRVLKSTKGYREKGTCNDRDDLCSKPGDVKILQDWAAKGWEIGESVPVKSGERTIGWSITVVVGGIDGQTCQVIEEEGLYYVIDLDKNW